MSVDIATERDRWLAERRRGIGASDAPSVVGIRTRPTRLEVWMDKRGELAPSEPTEAMRWGLALEPLIAEAYTERTGRKITRTQIQAVHPRRPWMRATIDAYDSNADLVEFKAVGRWGAKGLGDDGEVETLPEAWIVQVQHQMAVEEAERCHVAVFIDMGLRLYTVERNDDLINDLITLESEFWGLVESGTPPAEFQPEDAGVLAKHFNRETGEMVELRGLETEKAVCAYHQSCQVITEAKADHDTLKAQLLMAMGNASTATCGPYTLKRKLINVKADPHPKPRAASSYVRFSVINGDTNDE